MFGHTGSGMLICRIEGVVVAHIYAPPCKKGPSSRRSRVKPGKVTVKSAPPARPTDGASAIPDTDLPQRVRRLSDGRAQMDCGSGKSAEQIRLLASCSQRAYWNS